ncbi:MAG: SLATT domain-containing protein, partial [Gammaproteobacteria bacterium]|nr:SLATT domain-containing protein [Gammaproteobacteria bacterium]
MNDPRPELDAEAGRLEEDVLYSEKAHFGMATFWGRVHFFLGIPSALAAAASGVSAFRSEPLVAASLAVISAFLTGLLTFLDPKKVAATHHAAGVEYADLRGRLRRLRAIDLWGGADLKVCRCEL